MNRFPVTLLKREGALFQSELLRDRVTNKNLVENPSPPVPPYNSSLVGEKGEGIVNEKILLLFYHRG